MEKIALNNNQLDYLADLNPHLRRVFEGAIACDELPEQISMSPKAYIVNTDTKDKPGRHWLGVWTEGRVCEIMDSYGMPLEYYEKDSTYITEFAKRFQTVKRSSKTLQSLFSKSCGDYALLYLFFKAEGKSMQDFLKHFSDKDYVRNDRIVGEWLTSLVVKEVEWSHVNQKPIKQVGR